MNHAREPANGCGIGSNSRSAISPDMFSNGKVLFRDKVPWGQGGFRLACLARLRKVWVGALNLGMKQR
jgi:hypothetical protein